MIFYISIICFSIFCIGAYIVISKQKSQQNDNDSLKETENTFENDGPYGSDSIITKKVSPTRMPFRNSVTRCNIQESYESKSSNDLLTTGIVGAGMAVIETLDSVDTPYVGQGGSFDGGGASDSYDSSSVSDNSSSSSSYDSSSSYSSCDSSSSSCSCD